MGPRCIDPEKGKRRLINRLRNVSILEHGDYHAGTRVLNNSLQQCCSSTTCTLPQLSSAGLPRTANCCNRHVMSHVFALESEEGYCTPYGTQERDTVPLTGRKNTVSVPS